MITLQTEVFTPGSYEAAGSVILGGGQVVPYRSICQDHLFYNDDGKPIGSMFTYSYFRSDIEDAGNRPVVFVFNGGPGSGSLWLQAGMFGPMRVRYDDADAVNPPSLPPYRVENNELCLIDIADFVFIDPVGAGYGRLLDKDSAERFWNMDNDTDSFNSLIQSWLSKYQRWGSPKYLLGESYGTNRAALLAESLSGCSKGEFSAVGLNGLILLGSAIGQIDDMVRFNTTEESLLSLPSMAATNWYHNKLEGSVESFIQEAYAFCENEYVNALFKGDALGKEERERIAEKIAHFSGLGKDYVMAQNLRPKKVEYLKVLLKDKGLEAGVYDSRFTLPINRDFSMENMVQDDAAMAQYSPSFMAAMCGVYRQALGITHDRKYYGMSTETLMYWKAGTKRSSARSLAASMRRNPELKILFATGMYDIQCQMGEARYLVNHIGLDVNRVKMAEYPSGHMAYLGEDAAKRFASDVRAMIEGTMFS